MADVKEIAGRILHAYESHVPISPIRTEVQGVPAAYAVQQANVNTWLARGRTVAGHKIGLTAEAVQKQLGVNEPDFGTLFSDMVLRSGAVVPPNAVMQPRIEAEIAFVLKSDITGGDLTPEKVLAATDYVCPALEICGSRIERWDIRIEDTIADNASSGMIVLGDQRSRFAFAELADVAMTLQHNGQAAGEGRGAACLGNPAIAVAWLGNALARFGGRLQAGHVVMSGALAKMVTAERGSSFSADFGKLGQVAVKFAP